jgi:hypothetical protein
MQYSRALVFNRWCSIIEALECWAPGQGPGDDSLSWSPLNLATKTQLLTALLPNSSATGALPRIFINGLGALNQDVPSLRP